MIRIAKPNEKDFCDVFALLLELHKEGGYAPLDTEKATRHTFDVLTTGTVFIAYEGDEPAGTLSLTETAFWYSEETFLYEKWFYVKPEYRFEKIGVALLREARKEAEKRNKILMVSITNPDRKPKKTKVGLYAQGAGYVPLGYTLKAR